MTEAIHTVPARVIERALSTEQLKALIRADLGDIEPFFWTAEISNNRLDFYFGRMGESTLRNFAQDAIAGVSFLDSHNDRNLGYGQSLHGVFEAGGEHMRTVADFYTVPGIRFGSGLTYASTDDWMRAVQTRVVRDVSVGFYGGQSICDICGEDVWAIDWENWRYECPHMPGLEYPIGEQGAQTILATFTVEDARLAEVSGVYDGATPGAAIEKAQRMIDAGEMPPEMVRRLEVKYRIKLPGAARSWPGVDLRGKQAPERTGKMDELEQIRALMGELNATGETVIDQVRWLVEENARLAPLADDGRAYRVALTDAALAEGVRAMGDRFPQETYRTMFATAPLDHIRQLLESWGGQAAQVFTGGRQTEDAHTPPAAQERRERETPKAAYRV